MSTKLQLDLLIGGEFEPGTGEPLLVENPATEEVVAEIRTASTDQTRRAAQEARKAFLRGDLGDAEARSQALHSLADLIADRADEILEIVVREVGTPVTTARALHVGVPVDILHFAGDAALKDRTLRLGRKAGPPANDAMVLYRPAGVIAGITAYNVPLMFAAAKAGAAIAAGCPIVLLPSPQAPLSTMLFGRLAIEAGLAATAISVLTGGVEVAQALIGSPDIAKVSFTGSVPAGVAVMRAAAEGVKGVVLELGGKSACIVLPSADVSQIVAPIHHRYLRNAGQGCAAPTRLLVHEDRVNDFIEASKQVYAEVPVGDPWDPRTLVGPVISRQHQQRVLGHIEGAVSDGGRAVARAATPDDGRGFFVPPTLIAGLDNTANINQQEVFGPVASLISYRTAAEAIEIANSTEFGLHASIFGDLDAAMDLAPSLHVGHVSINGGGPLRPDIPTGGWNRSGIGREFGDDGVREFLEPIAVQWTV